MESNEPFMNPHAHVQSQPKPAQPPPVQALFVTEFYSVSDQNVEASTDSQEFTNRATAVTTVLRDIMEKTGQIRWGINE